MRMMMAVMALALTLTACNEQKREVKDTIFAPPVKALEKARGVEDKLKQGEEKNREALKASENADADAAPKVPGAY